MSSASKYIHKSPQKQVAKQQCNTKIFVVNGKASEYMDKDRLGQPTGKEMVLYNPSKIGGKSLNEAAERALDGLTFGNDPKCVAPPLAPHRALQF